MNASALDIKAEVVGWRDLLAEAAALIEAAGRESDRAGTFVAKNLDLLEELGFFALGVPAELGGGGAAYSEVAEMLRALGRLDGSTALALSMHTHQVMVLDWKRRHMGAPTEGSLRQVAGGLRILSSGGSDWLPGSGRAERVEGGYRIYAHKVFSSGAPAGDVMNTSAILHGPDADPVVLHFGLAMDDPAVTVLANWNTLGMRGTASHDVDIDGAFVPEAAIVASRPVGKWHPLFHVISLLAFPLVYSVYAGVADGAREAALQLARKRRPDTLGLLAVGELENAHAAMDLAARALVDLGATAAPGVETTHRVMTLRGLAGRAAMEVGTKALDVGGGAGFFRPAGLELRFRDLQAARFHPLQDRPQQLYAGRFALGLDIDGEA
jgi:acyl-CoA dehydrogenase